MLIYKLNYNEPLEMASPFHYYTAIFSQIFDLVNARYRKHLKRTLKINYIHSKQHEPGDKEHTVQVKLCIFHGAPRPPSSSGQCMPLAQGTREIHLFHLGEAIRGYKKSVWLQNTILFKIELFVLKIFMEICIIVIIIFTQISKDLKLRGNGNISFYFSLILLIIIKYNC